MKRAVGWDEVETREAIRQTAYELSRSGMCEGWQDVWKALRTRFGVEQLTVIFENPLCRIDIDQRCFRARHPGRNERELQTDTFAIRRNVEKEGTPPKPQPMNRETRKTVLLTARILEVLGDGSECTALELAQRLGVSRNEIFIAVRVMLVDEALTVTRYVAAKHGGRGARVFACAVTNAGQKNGEHALHAPWPFADPVAATASDAIAGRG